MIFVHAFIVMNQSSSSDKSDSIKEFDIEPSTCSSAYICQTCHLSLRDPDEALDHFEEFSSAHDILVIRPVSGDHVYVNRVDGKSPWIRQHHGIVVCYENSTSMRICHLDHEGVGKVIVSSITGFTNGSDLYLIPVRPVRVDPTGFALACVGKRGYDAQSFNCEHFVNWCLLCDKRSDMNNKAFWVVTGVAGTAVTAFGGVVGTGLWLAGKTAYIGKLALDHFGVRTEQPKVVHCVICDSDCEVCTQTNCGHAICAKCGLSIGRNRVCPYETCFDNFFRFTLINKA